MDSKGNNELGMVWSQEILSGFLFITGLNLTLCICVIPLLPGSWGPSASQIDQRKMS